MSKKKKEESMPENQTMEVANLTEQQVTEVLSALANVGRKKGTKEITTTVQHSNKTRTIIVPEGMDLLTASKELKAQYDNLEQTVVVARNFEGYNWRDSLVAVKKVSEAMFGWINGISEKDWMGNQYPPSEIDITTNVINGRVITEKCFYGKFSVAAWDKAEVNVGVSGSTGEVTIHVTSKKKYSNDVSVFFDAVNQHLASNSIYMGKTIVVTGGNSVAGGYEFEIIENKPADLIVLNENESLVLEEFILGDIGEPGKKCYLFTGPYGNGKTETAMAIGREANKQGIPFFYIKDAKLFDVILNKCKKYQPCIVFLEDVDEIGSGDTRDDKMNKILNTLDGVQTKGNSLTVIFTTNHEKRINPALRRPGRIDIVVTFTNPTEETRKMIYQRYFNGIEGADAIDYDEVARHTSNVSGSVVAQIAKRAVKLASRRGNITTKMAMAAITSMENHIKLMAEDVEGEPIQNRVVRELGEVLVGNRIKLLEDSISKIATELGVIL